MKLHLRTAYSHVILSHQINPCCPVIPYTLVRPLKGYLRLCLKGKKNFTPKLRHKLTCKWKSVPKVQTHTSEKSNPLPGETLDLGGKKQQRLNLFRQLLGKEPVVARLSVKWRDRDLRWGKEKIQKYCAVGLVLDPGVLSFTLPLFLNDACLSLSLFLFPPPPDCPSLSFFFFFILFLASRFRVLASPNSAQWHDKSESF